MSRKQYLLTFASLFFLVLISATTHEDPEYIPTDPYKFVYPANFGNKITIPADNPTTIFGQNALL
jgi:cytochrome c peroxidase